MPVYAIDTLKPKNGLDFPVVEAIDVAVEGYSSLADAVTHFATDTAIAALTDALDGKADKTTTDDLQAQINQIAQAAGTGSADTEVAQARVGSDGTTYQTLKDRLDAEFDAQTSRSAALSENISELTFAKKTIYGRGLLNSACTGLESTTSDYHTRYTTKFPVSVGDKFAYKGYGNYGHASVAWFDENGSKISAEEYQSKTEFTEITVPSGAYFAMFASYSDLALPIVFEVYKEATEDYIGTPKEIKSIHDDVDAVDSRVDDVNDRIDGYIIVEKEPCAFSVTARSLISAKTGAVIEYPDDNYTTATFDVTELSSLYITGSANFDNFVYVILNANDERIGGLKSANTSEGTVKRDYHIDLPEGAATIIVANHKTQSNPQEIEIYTTQEGFLANQLSESVHESIIDDIDTRVDVVDDRIDGYIIYEKNPYEFTLTPKSLISAKTGAVIEYPDDNYTTATFDVTELSSLYITGSANFGNFIYVVYDENDERIRGLKAANTSAGTVKQDFLLDLPDGAVTLIVANVANTGNPAAIELYQMQEGFLANRLSATIQNSIDEEINSSVYGRWGDKKWVCIGDSLTEVNSKTTKHYFDYVADATGINVVNMGVSGTGYMRRYDENLAFYQRAAAVPTDANVVTIFGSGNDLSLISVLGEPTDTGTETICGCINETIDVIIGLIPDVSLGIVSPTPWSNNKPTLDDSNAMAQYTEALREICKIRSIPFLDLYHCSNLRPWTAEGRAACYSKDGGDGVHPDETGHKLIAPRFKSFLDNLIL